MAETTHCWPWSHQWSKWEPRAEEGTTQMLFGKGAAPPWLSSNGYCRSKPMDKTTNWRPISDAPDNDIVYVRGPGLKEQPSEWGKVSHVPLYGWLNMDFDDPEDITILVPQPTEWLPLADYDAP